MTQPDDTTSSNERARQRRRRPGRVKKIVFSLALLLCVAAVVESVLQVVSFASPAVDYLLLPRMRMDDAVLGSRPHPGHPEHDAWGFRNLFVPTSAHVVAMGDSQTYGTGVGPDEAWPRQLADITGATIYSMALGSYAPTHSLALWPRAASLSPRVVVEALYSGNDIPDCYAMAYYRGQLPHLRTSDPVTLEQLAETDASEHLDDAAMARMPWLDAAPPPPASLKHRVFGWSRLYQLVRAVRRRFRPPKPAKPDVAWESWKATAATHGDLSVPFEDKLFRTIFTPPYRLRTLDPGDPRVAEGTRLALASIAAMAEKGAASGVTVCVLLVPTKELAFRPIVEASGRDPGAAYHELMVAEEAFWRHARAFFDERGIPIIDGLAPLRAEIVRGVQPYQISFDGHPNPAGHRALAMAVAAWLREKGFLVR